MIIYVNSKILSSLLHLTFGETKYYAVYKPNKFLTKLMEDFSHGTKGAYVYCSLDDIQQVHNLFKGY